MLDLDEEGALLAVVGLLVADVDDGRVDLHLAEVGIDREVEGQVAAQPAFEVEARVASQVAAGAERIAGLLGAELGPKAIESLEPGVMRGLLRQAGELLQDNAGSAARLEQKVLSIVRIYDPDLRCARPAPGPQGDFEPLNGRFPLPPGPARASILAADGSQLTPDRHAPVNIGLINIGAILASLPSIDAPQIQLQSELIYGDQLVSTGGTLSEAQLALMRDLRERHQLAKMAETDIPPVISFTDGPMELWGGRDAATSREFQQSLEEYLGVLKNLQHLNVATAGYVDKPASSLVVRLLEVASLPDDQLPRVRETTPLRGVLDRDLFQDLLEPGERSAVFAIQSSSAQSYPGSSALHFFYLNEHKNLRFYREEL